MYCEHLKQKLLDLPAKPGVYIMRDASGAVIYVGKAKSLKSRVRQYFHYPKVGDKVHAMVTRIHDFDYVLTNSETDALLLEANLIKRYRPQYNILLKDDKNFPYLRIDPKSAFPRLTIVRKLKKDGAKYFGPYMGVSLKELLELIHSAYPLRTCARNFEGDYKKSRACLSYHMGRCPAPCEKRVTAEEYRELVNRAMAFLSGRDEHLEEVLTEKMLRFAKSEDFESAILFRNRLEILKKLRLKKVAALEKSVNMDIFAVVSNGADAAVSMLYVREGKMTGAKSYALTAASLEAGELTADFLMQFYSDGLRLPPEIIVSGAVEEAAALEEIFSESAGRKVKIVVPKQGIKRALAVMAENNAKEFLQKGIERAERREQLTTGALELLQEYLGLQKLPRRIECFDISNISGTDKAASMAVMTDGESDRKEYRRFRIKTVEGADDFASLRETLLRRFNRAHEEGGSFSALPDLVVIDGGKGQLQSALEGMREAGFDLPMISLAERDEEIFIPDTVEPLRLPKSNLALRLLQRVRDEAHRFAVSYHRSLRNRRLESGLSEIPDIGAKRRAALLRRFKSLEAVKRASVPELSEVPGISAKLAERIAAHFAESAESGETSENKD